MRKIKEVIRDMNPHRLEWRAVSGNSVIKHYDRYCKYFSGTKHILKDSLVDCRGNYHDAIIYEIIFD